MKIQPVQQRFFLGKLDNPIDYNNLEASKADRHFQQRMLRAYLKGHTHFNYGFTRSFDGRLIPIKHEVLQSTRNNQLLTNKIN